MPQIPPCPQCKSPYAYPDRGLFVCPECAHEWNSDVVDTTETKVIYRDAHGNELNDGDTVTLIKDLKIKGSSAVIKVGTRVRNIRLVEGDHNIDCKVDGIGAMQLKSEFVKKA